MALIDYLSRENDIPVCTNYDDIRTGRLQETLYPAGVILSDAAMGANEHKEQALRNAIPEFLRFNIVESEVRNVRRILDRHEVNVRETIQK